METMKICFTLDDVIRAKTRQIGKMYQKYVNNDIDLDSLDLENQSLSEALGFEGISEYRDFLYKDYAFEVFGEAPCVERMLDKKLNLWHIEVNNADYAKNVQVMLANPREFNASIGFTYFFLSQIATRIREVFFPLDYVEIWDRCDVLVTADKYLLEAKPEGKIAIKIETDYNKGCEADYTYESLSKFLDDKEIVKTLCEKE